MKILMHFNASLQHQCDHAHAFIKGSDDIIVTDKPGGEADVHIISGPNFAYEQLRHHESVLMIDRAWFDDPTSVSIGWLEPDGSRKFATGTKPRPHPTPEPWKTRECSCLILADYNQDITEITYQAKIRFTTVKVRLHPSNNPRKWVTDLETDLRLSDVAIGHKGTAMFNALMQGLPVICTDPKNECMPMCAPTTQSVLYRGDRDKWLKSMAYKQFTLNEIADGTAWGLLKEML